MQSENINEIASALNKAQAQMMGAAKDAKNPFFKSKYATLNSVWEAVKDAVLTNGLTVLQPIHYANGQAVVTTTILHTSGQYITSECPVVCAKQNDPQAFGSAITYARRYSLASMLGVTTDEDDDAERAMNRVKPAPAQQPAPKTPQKRYEEFKSYIGKLSELDMDDENGAKIIERATTLMNELRQAGNNAAADEMNLLLNNKMLAAEKRKENASKEPTLIQSAVEIGKAFPAQN